MKTYGQIDYERRAAMTKVELPSWKELTDAMRVVSEAGAQAVIEEFKRRHNIVIPPEED